MIRALILFGVIFCVLGEFSCKGVKNVSGTLTKSESRHRDYSKDSRTDYTKIPEAASPTKEDTVYPATPPAVQPSVARSPVISQTAQQPTGDSYRKDYGRIAYTPTETSMNASGSNYAKNDLNDKLVKQYADMDRLADLVLYELGIVERRFDLLLGRFKTASGLEREKISDDLDQLNADQLKLYKAHVQIYKDGKLDWPQTKREVEAVLLALRGIIEK